MNRFAKGVEAVIGLVSPGLALSRATAVAKQKILQDNVRRYEAASGGRRTEGWKAGSTGANAENRGAQRTLRDRSRDLVRNNPYAKKAVRIVGTNAVGTGIRPQPLGKGSVKTRIRKAWKAWAESTACDFNGRRTFYSIQRAVIRAVCESGEALVVRRRLTSKQANGGPAIQLQILESDYLDSNKDNQQLAGGGRIIQGVEFDASGRRVAYWIYDQHPGDGYGYGSYASHRVPADDVLHVYEENRPGQVRGLPLGVSAMLRLRDFDSYEDAQLQRQIVAACFAMFYSGDSDGGSLAGGIFDTDPETDALPTRLEPGMIERLPNGASVTMASPPPVVGYDEYARRSMQGVAAGFGVTYEQLTGDFGNVNFSSARMARNEFDAWLAEIQEDILVLQLCAPVYRWFMDSAMLAGIITNAGDGVQWTMPARQMIDPVKEVKALSESVRAGFTSWGSAVQSLGQDPEEMREAISADNKANDSAGLILTTDPRKYGISGPVAPEKPTAPPSAPL